MRKMRRFLSFYRKRLPRDKPSMSKIYVAGVRPAAGYGAMILGFADGELRALRSTLMAGRSPAHK
eukprot:451790-Pyramimonas_sp.AAC.1